MHKFQQVFPARSVPPAYAKPVILTKERLEKSGVGAHDGTGGAVGAALAHARADANVEISVLFTGDVEAAKLNTQWRHKDYAPNILYFPA